MEKLLILLCQLTAFSRQLLSAITTNCNLLLHSSNFPNTVLRKNLQFLSTGLAILLLSNVATSQSANDYRTKATGNWSDPDTWEVYNGSSWVALQLYAYPNVAATNNSTQTASTTHNVALPTGIVAGDLLLIYWADYNTNTSTITVPTGWTALYNAQNGSRRYAAFYKVANGTEGATINFPTSANEVAAHTSYRISNGYYTAVPVTGTAATGSSTGSNPPALTSGFGVVNTLWIAASHSGGTSISSYPSSYTLSQVSANTGSNDNTHASMAIAARQLQAASDDPANFTLSASRTWSAQTIAIQGAAVVGAIPSNTVGAITIRNGHTVTVDANTTVDQVTVDAGGRLDVDAFTLTLNNGTGTDMTVNGILAQTNGSSAITINAGATISAGAGGSYIHARNGGAIPVATWNNTSTCSITGVTGSVPSGLNQSFGNFTWNCTGQSSNRNLNGALTTVNGNLTVSSTNGRTLYLTDNTTLSLTIGGNLNLSNGELTFAQNNSASFTMNLAGDLNISGGDLIFAEGNNATVTVNVNGNFSQSNGTIDLSNATQVGIMTLNVTGNFTQSGGGFDFASGGANTARTPALNLSGNFSQTGSATMWTSTSDTDITNGTITFNKNGTQTFSIVSQGAMAYVNFVVAASSITELNSNLTLSSINAVSWGGRFTVNSSGTVNFKTNQLLSEASTGVYNTFVLNSGGTVMTANTNGLQSGTSGSVSTGLATRTYSSGANYVYNGTATQNSGTFTTSPTANQVNNLTVNNTGGGTGITLQQVFAIAGTCYFTAGRITSSSTNLLIFNDNAIASGANNNVSNPSYVNGPVRKIGNDAFTFPVGKSNVGYMLCGISAPSSTSDAFTAEYFRNSASALGPITAVGLYRVSACEYWQLDRTTGSSSVNVTLSWSGLSPCNASAYVNSLASLVVAHFNGTSWNTYGNSGGTTGNGAAGTVTWNNVSVFSPFSLGSTSAVANPLPIRFTDVKAFKVTGGNKIEWKNLTEENIQRYEVERSANGTIFSTITSVSPKSNNGLEQAYTVTDENPLSSTNFYRIKGVEVDGTFVYSTIVKVVSDGGNKNSIAVYPNPVTANQFTIQLNNYDRGNYSVQLISANGQRMLMKNLQHAGGSASVSMEKPVAAQAGIYILQITGDNRTENIKLVIK